MITDQDLDDAHADSKPLLEWRDLTQQPQRHARRLFQLNEPGKEFWAKAEQDGDGGWWFHMQLVCSRIEAYGDEATAKTKAKVWMIEKLEQVLSELKRGVA